MTQDSEERLVELMCRVIVDKSVAQKFGMVTATREYLQGERGLDADGVKEIVDTMDPLTNTDTIAETRRKGVDFFAAIKKHGVFMEVADVIGATNTA